jgi:hypothetical protein
MLVLENPSSGFASGFFCTKAGLAAFLTNSLGVSFFSSGF